jgi:SAM-dependent methyltransferase
MFLYTPAGFSDVSSCGAFYDVRTTVFEGEDMMVLEYSELDMQRSLFERATQLLPPQGKVLDLGSGLGHLLDYLDEQHFPYDEYLGIDVSERMVVEARRRHGELFERRDILTSPFEAGRFDSGYILSVLGYPIGKDPMATMMAIIEKTYSACRGGIVFSHLVTGRKEGLTFTTVPEELAAECERALGAKAQIDDWGSFTYLLALRHPTP